MPAPGTGTRETALALDLAVQIYPTPMTDLAVGVTLEVDGRAAQTLPAAPDAAVAGQYRVVLPAGALTYPEGTRVWGSAHVVANDGGVVSTPRRQLPLVEATVLVDSTNNTTVDAEDDAAKRRGDAWAFWEADPAQMDVDGAPTEKGLTDFATVRLEVNQSVSGLALRLRGPDPERAAATRWSLTEKVAGPETGPGAADQPDTLRYLWGEHSSGAQRLAASQPCLTANGRLRGRCQPSGLLSDSIALPTNLSAGTHEFLLRCENCPVGEAPPGQAVPTRQLEVVYTPANAGAVPIVADAAPVDIRPLRQWMSVVTARRDVDPDGDGPLSLFTPRDALEPVPGWRADVPPQTTSLTVIVHGFNVTRTDALTGFFPAYLKRLYWAGHRVIEAQGAAHVVGLDWPGNEHQTGLSRLQDIRLLGGLIENLNASMYFQEDEFHALQMGKPLSDWLQAQKSTGRRMQILAHSLGNVVVNSALTFLQAGVVDSYVMNEATVPIEAFDAAAQPDDSGIDATPGTLLSHASAYGFGGPAPDARWWNGWQTILEARSHERAEDLCQLSRQGGGVVGCGDEYYVKWATGRDSLDLNGDGAATDADLGLAYGYRWSQTRPPGWRPDSLPESPSPSRGSWRGFFAGNPSKVGRFTNTVNRHDWVVNVVWRAHQIFQKPAVGIRGLQGDSETAQLWGTLPGTTAAEHAVWMASMPPIEAVKNTTRQWAELAYWFPSTTAAVGVTPSIGRWEPSTSRFIPCELCDFTETVSEIRFVRSHGYLGDEPFAKVLRLFRVVTVNRTGFVGERVV